jgi:hypothetical protein
MLPERFRGLRSGRAGARMAFVSPTPCYERAPMAMRIWHQSFTALENLPAYEAVLQAHMQRVCQPDTEVVLHGLHPDTYRTRTAHRGIDIR